MERMGIVMRHISLIVVHHTVTPLDRPFDEIRYDHMKNRGWSDIGYHYVVNSLGDLRLGRPVWRSGAHVKGKNRHSIGIGVVGNYQHDKLSYNASIQLTQLLDDLVRHFPGAEVVGHRDVAATLCPGKNLYEWLKEEYI